MLKIIILPILLLSSQAMALGPSYLDALNAFLNQVEPMMGITSESRSKEHLKILKGYNKNPPYEVCSLGLHSDVRFFDSDYNRVVSLALIPGSIQNASLNDLFLHSYSKYWLYLEFKSDQNGNPMDPVFDFSEPDFYKIKYLSTNAVEMVVRIFYAYTMASLSSMKDKQLEIKYFNGKLREATFTLYDDNGIPTPILTCLFEGSYS